MGLTAWLQASATPFHRRLEKQNSSLVCVSNAHGPLGASTPPSTTGAQSHSHTTPEVLPENHLAEGPPPPARRYPCMWRTRCSLTQRQRLTISVSGSSQDRVPAPDCLRRSLDAAVTCRPPSSVGITRGGLPSGLHTRKKEMRDGGGVGEAKQEGSHFRPPWLY